jgi:hypothetical protein
MVLPAHLAEGVRSMSRSGGDGGGKGGDTHNWTINATDAASFQMLLTKNGQHIANLVKHSVRSGQHKTGF